jgi:hypothetical protein
MLPSTSRPSPAKSPSNVPNLPQTSLQATGTSGKTISSVFNRVFDSITPEMLRRVTQPPESISGSELYTSRWAPKPNHNADSSVPEVPLRSDLFNSTQLSALGEPSVQELPGSAAQEKNSSVPAKIRTPIADEFMAVKLSMKPSCSVPNFQTELLPPNGAQESFIPPDPPLMPPIPTFGFVPNGPRSSFPKFTTKEENKSLASPHPASQNVSLAGEMFVAKLRNDAKEGKEKASSAANLTGIAHPLSPAPATVKSTKLPQSIEQGQKDKLAKPTESVQWTQEAKPARSTEVVPGLAASKWAPLGLTAKATRGNGNTGRR